MQRILVIANGEKSYVNRKRAERLVHRGQARWENAGAIKLVDHSHRVVSATNCDRLRRDAALDRVIGTGLAKAEQIAGLPCCGDPYKALTLGGPRGQWRNNPPPRPTGNQNRVNHGG